MKLSYTQIMTRCLAVGLCGLLLISCEELQTGNSNTSLKTPTTAAPSTPTPAPVVEKYSKHDAALRFLTAYIRLDREMASKYASEAAISKLDWKTSHNGNIPYYDDKMLLQYSGGWARVFMQETDGNFQVSDLEVHARR
jgi:hypothetical protein